MAIFKPASSGLESSINCVDSHPNVENVVSDPSSPVMTKSWAVLGSFAIPYPPRVPSSSQPITLTRSVPYGKESPMRFFENPLIPYLKIAPTAPPAATVKMELSIRGCVSASIMALPVDGIQMFA